MSYENMIYSFLVLISKWNSTKSMFAYLLLWLAYPWGDQIGKTCVRPFSFLEVAHSILPDKAMLGTYYTTNTCGCIALWEPCIGMVNGMKLRFTKVWLLIYEKVAYQHHGMLLEIPIYKPQLRCQICQGIADMAHWEPNGPSHYLMAGRSLSHWHMPCSLDESWHQLLD